MYECDTQLTLFNMDFILNHNMQTCLTHSPSKPHYDRLQMMSDELVGESESKSESQLLLLVLQIIIILL